MSAGSARDRQFSGRRQNDEAEPFLLHQIHGSPVMRGRRQHSEEERFLVEEIPGSPIMRGRVPRVTSSTRIDADVAANTTTHVPGLNYTSDTIDGSIRIPATAPPSSSDSYATRPTHSRAPNTDDAPPSYESSIPPTQIGWATQVTSKVPFPMPYMPNYDDGRPSSAFSYPPSDSYPPIGLSPMAKSYLSIESSKSKSPIPSTSPSPSPSSEIYRPAYTYQTRRAVTTPQQRPPFIINSTSDCRFSRSQNQSYKYGGIVIAVVFVTFLMMLSLAVKFFIRNSFRK